MTEQPTLKSLTWDLHKKAEQTDLMVHLLNNTISDVAYAHLVYTKYQIYATIESRISFRTPGLARAQAALNDWQQITHELPPLMHELTLMLDHLRTTTENHLWAHVYVHYLAPLYGGQIIKRIIQNRFPTSMYDFTHPHESKQEIRQMLTVDMAPEANKSFEMTMNYYNQLWSVHAKSH